MSRTLEIKINKLSEQMEASNKRMDELERTIERLSSSLQAVSKVTDPLQVIGGDPLRIEYDKPHPFISFPCSEIQVDELVGDKWVRGATFNTDAGSGA